MIKYLKMEFSFENKEDLDEDIGFEEDLLEDEDIEEEDDEDIEEDDML
jgi:hypothetical protein